MGTRKQQRRDIRFYCWFIRKCKKYPWLFSTPIRYLEKLIFPHHRTVSAEQYYDQVLSAMGHKGKQRLEYYRDELMSDGHLKETYFKIMESEGQTGIEKAYERRFRRINYIVNYYALIRETRPSIVVETGTASGALTCWILCAMHKNSHGKLISIDIPPKKGEMTMSMTLERDMVGKYIPQLYRGRWEYNAGDAKELLPKILIENDVDIFVHDSLHTRTHMLFEYNCARTLMRPGTVIISHDILWNKAFFAFTASHNLQGMSCLADPNLGFVVNTFDEFEKNIGLGIVKVD